MSHQEKHLQYYPLLVISRHWHHSSQLHCRVPGPGGEACQEVPARLRPGPFRPQSQQHGRGCPRLQEEVRLWWNPDHRKWKDGRWVGCSCFSQSLSRIGLACLQFFTGNITAQFHAQNFNISNLWQSIAYVTQVIGLLTSCNSTVAKLTRGLGIGFMHNHHRCHSQFQIKS